MRVMLAILYVFFALVIFGAEHDRNTRTPPTVSIEEKVWMSQTCDNSRWYLEDSDDQTVTLACYKQPPDSEDK